MGSFDYKLSYRRNLHIQPEGATFFLTFRLAGSLPQSIVDQWKQERDAVFKPLPVTRAISLRRENVKETDQTRDLVYHSLASIMQSLKGYTAFQCNRLLERKGEFWAHESYDHYVRDAEEWNRIMSYVLNNPVKAGYVADWRDWKWNYRRE